MEISNLATAENEQNGKWFQVELYGKKQPFALKILGEESDKITKFRRQQMRRIPKDKTYSEMEEEDIDDLLEMNKESVIYHLTGISSIKTKLGSTKFELIDEPVILNGKILKDDFESYKYLIEQIPAITNFINDISRKRSNFLD